MKPGRMTSTRTISILVAVTFFLAACSTGEPVSRTLPDGEGRRSRCRTPLPETTSGTEAVEELGDDAQAVAEQNELTEPQLVHLLESDESFNIDRCGQAFYVDPKPRRDRGVRANNTGGAEESAEAEALPFPSAETFLLHSQPGASRTIFLDFDGQDITGTQWNVSYNGGGDFYSPAYDTDGNAASFSEAEREVVQSVWRRVAEDYAPFAVDVTTEDPGFAAIDRAAAGDSVYGTKVLLTDDSLLYGMCSCGGIAYYTAFDAVAPTHAALQPAFVFAQGVPGAKNLAEAASHEAGHNLNLRHDGVTGGPSYYGGADPWAPIMGVGYYRAITHFSKGEYANANQLQDDLAVIASSGAPYRSDDHGNAAGAATPLDGSLTTDGVISTTSDTDWFSFAGSGDTQVTLTVAPVAPNLDAKIWLYDTNGNLLAQADPASSMSSLDVATGLGATASATVDAAAGPFVVKVDGVGNGGSYSDYASLGAYHLVVTTGAGGPPPPPPPPAGACPATPAGYLLITGTAGSDIILGTSGNDFICALAGNDLVKSKSGNDIVYGGEGVDKLLGAGGNDTVNGEGGNDALSGGSGVDVCDQGAFTAPKPAFPSNCETKI